MNSEQLNNLNKPPKHEHLTLEQVAEKKAIVITKNCGCNGVRPKCHTCFGTGYFNVDGFGNYK